jgi:hypothetical protein
MCSTSRARALGAILLGLALAPTPARGLPLISEVFYDAAGSDDGRSFVELFGAPGSALDGFTLEGVNGANGAITTSLALSGSIPEDGLFLLADGGSDGTTLVPGADLVLDFDFQNGPDSIVLRNADGVADAVGYGTFGADEVFAGEGSPAPDAPADSSLARRFADVDSDDNSADWIVLATPTPGAAPLAGVPEPAPGVLFGGGLALLARLSRRRAGPG